MSLPEVILWDCLRKGRLAPFRFRRQHPVGAYILDFYCPSARLAVEVDGEGHGHPSQEAHDHARDAWLNSRGVIVLRVAAADILDDEILPGVVAQIDEASRLGIDARG
jgi:very-short-patch-repair endonuclease